MMRERLLAYVYYWQINGKGSHGLLRDQDYLKTTCWLATHAGSELKALPEVAEFMAACRDAYGGESYERYLRQRDRCTVCGESYKVENVSYCVECHMRYCARCRGDIQRDGHGGYLCDCGGQVVG